MPGVRISRGRLTSLWLVLRTLARLAGRAEVSDVMSMARSSGLRAGGLPVGDGLALAREGGFLMESAGVLVLGPLGTRALELGDQDEPTAEVLRLFLAVLLLRSPPTWVAWWQGSPEDLGEVIPQAERAVLQDARLFPPPSVEDPAGWAWWHALGNVPLPEQTSVARKQIGDAGEQLTFDYERARLSAQGRPELARDVAWLARESDAYGFDVLSYAGEDFPPLDPHERIAIEVKSTSLPVIERFPFYLTSHEWDVARTLGSRFVLHLWASVDPGPPPRSGSPIPLVRPGADLADHLPGESSCGELCTWQTAHLALEIT
jgi:hypothetical protein